MNILLTGVHCNCELSDLTGMAINLISHHLKMLQEQDW
ncbi:MAG: transcriptional regulator [Anaerolineaceae bacterium]|nr:transcriptional regulator [Anaerolineaceae bacterium]